MNKLTIEGIQEAQTLNNEEIADMKPNGRIAKIIHKLIQIGHRYAIIFTHVDTGALKGSHRMQMEGLRGEIFIDPGSRNPKTGVPPSEYGVYEHARGGDHAFYDLAFAKMSTVADVLIREYAKR